jgi:hypothetical protein
MSPRLAAELERLRAEEEAREAEKARKAGAQGSISQNSVSAENVSDKFSSPKFLANFHPKVKDMSLSEYYGHSCWIFKVF